MQMLEVSNLMYHVCKISSERRKYTCDQLFDCVFLVGNIEF